MAFILVLLWKVSFTIVRMDDAQPGCHVIWLKDCIDVPFGIVCSTYATYTHKVMYDSQYFTHTSLCVILVSLDSTLGRRYEAVQ